MSGRGPNATAYRDPGRRCQYCRKVCYSSKKSAKTANRRAFPHEKMSVYRCPFAPDGADTSVLWHIGHLPKGVKDGTIARSQLHGGATVAHDNDDNKDGTDE